MKKIIILLHFIIGVAIVAPIDNIQEAQGIVIPVVHRNSRHIKTEEELEKEEKEEKELEKQMREEAKKKEQKRKEEEEKFKKMSLKEKAMSILSDIAPFLLWFVIMVFLRFIMF